MKHSNCEKTVNVGAPASETFASGDGQDQGEARTLIDGCRLRAHLGGQQRLLRSQRTRATAESQKPSESDSERTGSRHRWPRCGARTRAGVPCVAAGAGFGGRCKHHGGIPAGSFVFFGSASFELPRRLRFADGPRQPWSVCVIPEWLAKQLPEHALIERDICEHAIRTGSLKWRTGHRAEAADVARRYPQLIGFRPALLLLERGRVSYGLFAYDSDVTRWTRARQPFEQAEEGPGLVRIEATDLLAAMRASGGPVAKRPPGERAVTEVQP